MKTNDRIYTIAEFVAIHRTVMENYLMMGWNKITSVKRLSEGEERIAILIKKIMTSPPERKIAVIEKYTHSFFYREEIPLKFFSRGVLKDKKNNGKFVIVQEELWQIEGEDWISEVNSNRVYIGWEVQWEAAPPMRIVLLKDEKGDAVIAIEEILPGEKPESLYISGLAEKTEMKLIEKS